LPCGAEQVRERHDVEKGKRKERKRGWEEKKWEREGGREGERERGEGRGEKRKG